MHKESAKISQMIENGDYFKNARRWYTTRYMSIIPERIFFIVLTSIAIASGLVALLALLLLMPLTPREPFLYLSDNALKSWAQIKPIRGVY